MGSVLNNFIIGPVGLKGLCVRLSNLQGGVPLMRYPGSFSGDEEEDGGKGERQGCIKGGCFLDADWMDPFLQFFFLYVITLDNPFGFTVRPLARHGLDLLS